MSADKSLTVLLRGLKLPGFVLHHESTAIQAEREGLSFGQYLRALAEVEHEERHQRRIARMLKAANLPVDKTLSTLDLKRLPVKVRRAVASLSEGGFIERAENILAFGLPGRGKTHVVAAIAHELIHKGYRVLFTPTYKLVQRLLVPSVPRWVRHRIPKKILLKGVQEVDRVRSHSRELQARSRA